MSWLKFLSFSRLRKIIFLKMSGLPVPSHSIRPRIIKWAGVQVDDPAHTFIGEDVIFDSNCPENIHIEKGVRITMRCIILTHYVDPKKYKFSRGHVILKEKSFLGANTIITKAVTIGKNSIVGAGSVVTKDIPDNEVWAGNPAKFIKKVERVTETSNITSFEDENDSCKNKVEALQ